jgi:hypothetical protein
MYGQIWISVTLKSQEQCHQFVYNVTVKILGILSTLHTLQTTILSQQHQPFLHWIISVYAKNLLVLLKKTKALWSFEASVPVSRQGITSQKAWISPFVCMSLTTVSRAILLLSFVLTLISLRYYVTANGLLNDAVASTNFVVSNCKVMSGCSTIWGLSKTKKVSQDAEIWAQLLTHNFPRWTE